MTNFRTTVSIMLVIMTASSTSRPSLGQLQSPDHQHFTKTTEYDNDHHHSQEGIPPPKEPLAQPSPGVGQLLPERLHFDNIFLLKSIRAGLLLSASWEHQLNTKASPGDQNPLTLWYMTFNSTTQLYSIRSLHFSDKYICISSSLHSDKPSHHDVTTNEPNHDDITSDKPNHNDANPPHKLDDSDVTTQRAVLSDFDPVLCSFEQKLVTRQPFFSPSMLQHLNLTFDPRTSLTSGSSDSASDPLHAAMWMSLAFRNPHTGCYLAFNHDSHSSVSYCLSSDDESETSLPDTTHFDKEKPEPQLVFQMTSSLRDIYPNHTSIYGIISSIDSRVKLALPFNLVDWQTGYSKPQFFVIHPEDYPDIKWTMLKHSYHLYQLPKRVRANAAPKKWKCHCAFNAYDIFATHPQETTVHRHSLVYPPVHTQTGEKTGKNNAGRGSEEVQKRFDELSLELSERLKSVRKTGGKSEKGRRRDKSFANVDRVAVELNSVNSKIVSTRMTQ